MEIRLLKDFRGKKVGDLINRPDDLAAKIIEAGIGEEATPGKSAKKRAKEMNDDSIEVHQ